MASPAAARPFRARKEVEDPNNTWDMQLMAACLNGDSSEAASLLQKGAKLDHTAPDSQGRMVTPFLAVAQKAPNADMLAWIAANGGNVNPQYNGDQGTVFHHLVRTDQLEHLEKLASARTKISPLLSLDEVDSTGQSAAQLAINMAKPEAARILLRHGARHAFHGLVDATHCQTARACATGQIQLLDTLLQVGDNPHQRDSNGQTLMHLAVQQPAVLDMLLDRGLSINATNWQGQTPLLWVVQNLPKSVEIIDQLVQRNADVNIGDSLGITPLMHAIIAYSSSMIRKLLECKADINVRDHFGGSALHWAVVARQKGALELLLSLEADVNAVDRAGESPLHRACTKGCLTSVNLLLSREGVDINIADKGGRVPLHAAVQEAQVSIVQALLRRCTEENPFAPQAGEKGKKVPPKKAAAQTGESAMATKLNIEAQDAAGLTPLQVAVALNHTVMVKMLVATGANVRRPSVYGTLLHEAVLSGNEEVVATLLGAKAIVDARDADDLTPLHLAAQKGLLTIASLLVKAGCTVDLQDANTLRTALHIAAIRNDAAMVNLVLTEGQASPHLTDKNVQTALHHAALNGSVPVVKLLLGAGAKAFRQQDIRGWTPLHCACSVDCAEAVPVLVSRQVVSCVNDIEVTSFETYWGDILATDHKGWVPLHVAVATGSHKCVAALLDLLWQRATECEETQVKIEPQEISPHHINYSLHDLVANKAKGESVKSVLAKAAAAATPYTRKPHRNILLEILNLADRNDRTPFMLAAEFGHAKIAKQLVAAKLRETNPNAAVAALG